MLFSEQLLNISRFGIWGIRWVSQTAFSGNQQQSLVSVLAMTKSFVQLAMFSLLIALASSAAAQATASTPEETPFLHGFDVSINGNAPVHFGLDTGAAIDFLITPEKAQQLGLPITGHRNIRTSDRQPLGSGDTVSIVKATTLKVAGRTFTPAEGDILKMSDRAAARFANGNDSACWPHAASSVRLSRRQNTSGCNRTHYPRGYASARPDRI